MSSRTPAITTKDCTKRTIAVTVVIPCFNAEASVAGAIESVRRQSDVDFEIICINDGSHDSTGAVLSKFATDGVIRHLDHADRRGASVARNSGLRAARGEFIRFLDADDTLIKDMLQRQVEIMRAEDVEMVAGAYEHIDSEGRLSTYYPDEDPWGGLLASSLGRTSSNIFRTTALHAVGGWNARQISSQEYDLMFRLLKSGARVAIDGIVGARLNATPGSISLTDEEGNAQRFIRLRREMKSYLERANVLSEYRRECLETIYRRARTSLLARSRP